MSRMFIPLCGLGLHLVMYYFSFFFESLPNNNPHLITLNLSQSSISEFTNFGSKESYYRTTRKTLDPGRAPDSQQNIQSIKSRADPSKLWSPASCSIEAGDVSSRQRDLCQCFISSVLRHTALSDSTHVLIIIIIFRKFLTVFSLSKVLSDRM